MTSICPAIFDGKMHDKRWSEFSEVETQYIPYCLAIYFTKSLFSFACHLQLWFATHKMADKAHGARLWSNCMGIVNTNFEISALQLQT